MKRTGKPAWVLLAMVLSLTLSLQGISTAVRAEEGEISTVTSLEQGETGEAGSGEEPAAVSEGEETGAVAEEDAPDGASEGEAEDAAPLEGTPDAASEGERHRNRRKPTERPRPPIPGTTRPRAFGFSCFLSVLPARQERYWPADGSSAS